MMSIHLSAVGPNTFNENETIAKYEIMDGAPVRGKGTTLLLSLVVNRKGLDAV